MVGDAMGDAQAAAANGVSFVPILPGREAESWRRLQEEALPKLLHGTFSPEYQATPAGSAAQRSARVIDRKIVEQKPKQSMQKAHTLLFFMQSIGFGSRHTAKPARH